MERYRPLAILSALAWGLLIGAALGDTIQATYTGAGSDNNWHNSANWQPATVPNGAGFCVTIPSSSGRIDFNNHAGFEELSIGAESEVRILQSWGLFTNVIENNGLITFGSVGLPRLQTSFDGSMTVHGSGTLRVAKTDTWSVLWGQNGTNAFTNGPNHTIEGYGYLTESLESLTNSGVITANVNGQTLQAINSVDILLDGGELRAESGGILMIGTGSDITGQNGGFLRVGDGSRIDLTNLTLTSTEIKVTNLDGDLINNRVTVGHNISASDVTNTARIEVLDDSNSKLLFISDAFVNHGEIIATGGSTGSTGIVVDGTATLSGQGRVELNAEQRHFISGTNASDTLTNGPGHTIEGQGIVGGGFAAIENVFNQGIIHSNLGGELSIQAGRAGDVFINEASGILRVSNSGTMTVPGFGTGGLVWTNRGMIDVQENCVFDAGLNPTLGNILPTTLEMESGQLTVDGEFETDHLRVSSGFISGGGEIRTSSIICAENVVIQPGNSVGPLTFTSNDPTFPFAACGGTFESDLSLHTDAVQLGGSTLDLDIVSPTSFDEIRFDEFVYADGSIRLKLNFLGSPESFSSSDELTIISDATVEWVRRDPGGVLVNCGGSNVRVSDAITGGLTVANLPEGGRLTSFDGRATFLVEVDPLGDSIKLTEPFFSSELPAQELAFEVTDQTEAGTQITTVQAPLEMAGTPFFAIVGDSPFDIDRDTGVVTATEIIDIESLEGSYTVSVNVYDGESVQINPTTFTIRPLISRTMITWETPQAIGYGTALSGIQLNAIASNPGTISYSPSSGVLSAGTHTLVATFSPDQAALHAPASKEVTLTVNPAPLTITGQDVTREEGQANPTFTAIYNGLVDGDTAVAITPSLTTTATTSSPAGTYPIVPAGASDPNYTISYRDGVLTVTPKPVVDLPVPKISAIPSGLEISWRTDEDLQLSESTDLRNWTVVDERQINFEDRVASFNTSIPGGLRYYRLERR